MYASVCVCECFCLHFLASRTMHFNMDRGKFNWNYWNWINRTKPNDNNDKRSKRKRKKQQQRTLPMTLSEWAKWKITMKNTVKTIYEQIKTTTVINPNSNPIAPCIILHSIFEAERTHAFFFYNWKKVTTTNRTLATTDVKETEQFDDEEKHSESN